MNTRNNISQFLIAIALYVFLLVGAIWIIRQGLAPRWEVPLALLPLLPGLARVWIVRTKILGMDELERRIQLEALSLAFGGLFLLLLTEELLGIADLSLLNTADLIISMSVMWMLGQLLARRRYQ